nr:unnamed protein product [Callosobruchus analis]
MENCSSMCCFAQFCYGARRLRYQ